MLYRIMSLVFFLSVASVIMGQANNQKLAQHYYCQGEYEKSADLFKKLSDGSGYNEYFFNQYIESLLAMEDYDTAAKAINSTIKKYPRQISLYVTYGNLLERQGQMDSADEQYRKAIAMMPVDRGLYNNLGNSFMRLTKYELAKEVLMHN